MNRNQEVVLEGEHSVSSTVDSGVPQGSVLGPLLFLIFINDLPEVISSKSSARLFADDCVLYRNIKSPTDAASLQQDLDKLQEWEKDWQMEFHPEKCQVMHITKKRKPTICQYNIHGHILEKTDTAKYLGVNISNNLSWNPHVDQVAKKASNINNFLRRNINQFPSKTKEMCYLTFVRPVLEYACTVWDPHTRNNIIKLEAVQRRAARFVCGDHRTTSSVQAMLNQLNWQTLEQRRKNCKTIMMYRIVYKLVDIPSDDLIPQATSTRGQTSRFLVPYARTITYQKSFFPDTIRLWNHLPQSSVDRQTLEAFRQGLMEKEDDYLTCGKCMTEFKLDKITSFIKHKTKDCQEPALSTESNAELVCSSCPKGFMTAVGLLKHAQTNHNLKLFFERTSDVTGIQDVTVTHDDMVTSPDTNHHSSVDSLLASQGLLDSLAVKDMYDSSSSQMEEKATNSSGLYLKNHSQHYMSQPNVCHSGLQYTGSCFKGPRAAQSVGTQHSSNASASQSLGQSSLVSNSLYNSSPMQGSCTTQSVVDSIDIQTSGISSPDLHHTSGTTHFVSQNLYSEPHNSGQSVYPSHVSSSAFQKSGNISQTFSPSTFSMSNSLDSAPVQSSYQVPSVNNSGTMPVYVSCHAPVLNSESTVFVSQSVLTNTIQPSQAVAQHSIPSTCTSNPSSDIWSQISSGQSISSALLDLIMKSGVILPVVNKTSEDIHSFTAYPSIPQDSGPNTLHSLFHDNPTEDKYNHKNKHSNENQDGTKDMVNVLVQAKPSVTSKQQGSLPSVKLLLEAARRARLNSQGTAKSVGKRSLDVTTSEIACTSTDENRTSLFTSVTSVPCSHVPLNTYFNDNMKGQNNLLVTSVDNPNIKGDSSNTFNYLPDSLYHNDPLHHVNLGKAMMTKDSGHKTNAPTMTSTIKNHPADPQKAELSRRAESEDKCNLSFDQNVTKFHSVKLIDKPLPDDAHQTITGLISSVSLPVTAASTMVSSSTSSPSDNPCTSSSQISSDTTSTEAKNGSESSPSNENSDDDSVTLGCCDSKNCGVTVIPGTHEGLKKCCNAVVPKKRKRHFETKHTMSYRQKLKRRISGSESGRLHKNVDKKNSGTIFIDLEPNEDGSLSEKSSSNNNGIFASSPPSSFGFQVSGLSRNMANSQSNPKGTVILQPGAIFSIPIAYSLSTQSDGSIQPLVISQHAFQSKSSLEQDRTTAVAKSSDTSGTTDSSKPESSSNAEGPWNTSSQGPESHLLKDEDDSSVHLRRRRYPTSRPFKCEKCDSAFNQRIHLKKHMSKHTGVKPFKCNQCNYSTVERSHLKVHIRIHTGEKPFKCTYCEYATAQNSTLKIHLKRHHKPSE